MFADWFKTNTYLIVTICGKVMYERSYIVEAKQLTVKYLLRKTILHIAFANKRAETKLKVPQNTKLYLRNQNYTF